jgi:hypothetical protein
MVTDQRKAGGGGPKKVLAKMWSRQRITKYYRDGPRLSWVRNQIGNLSKSEISDYYEKDIILERRAHRFLAFGRLASCPGTPGAHGGLGLGKSRWQHAL